MPQKGILRDNGKLPWRLHHQSPVHYLVMCRQNTLTKSQLHLVIEIAQRLKGAFIVQSEWSDIMSVDSVVIV